MDTNMNINSFPDGYCFDPPRNRPHEYLVVDFERTDLTASARIVEAACVRVKAGHIVGRWEALVRPGRPMGVDARRVTRITDKMLEGAMEPEEAWRQFAAFVGTKAVPMFAHNMPFDARAMFDNGAADFMEADCPLCCSLQLARKAFPGMPSHALGFLCEEFGIRNPAVHRAAGDTAATAALIEACYRKSEEEQGLEGQLHIAKMLDYPPCPECRSFLVIRDGKTEAGSQLYRCKDCGKKYTEEQINASRRKDSALTIEEARELGGGVLRCRHCHSDDIRKKDRRGRSVRYVCNECRRTTSFRME